MKSETIKGKQAEVLRYIALHGATTEYEQIKLQKENNKDALSLSKGTLHLALTELEKKQLLTIKPMGRARTGRTIKEYNLNVRGVASAINIIDTIDTRKDVEKIAERWGSLIPLVLGKWRYLGGKLREGKLHDRLDLTVRAFLSPEFIDQYSIWYFVDLGPAYPPMGDEYLFTCLFYDLNIIVMEPSGWVEAIKDDGEIRDFIVGLFPGYEGPHRRWLEGFAEFRGRLGV